MLSPKVIFIAYDPKSFTNLPGTHQFSTLLKKFSKVQLSKKLNFFVDSAFSMVMD
jgi:hypothetical protein